MNQNEARVLQETHDSTIRQEVMITGIVQQLAAGEKRFKEHHLRMDAQDATDNALRADVNKLLAGRKMRSWLARSLVGALMLAAGAWAWDRLVALFSHKP